MCDIDKLHNRVYDTYNPYVSKTNERESNMLEVKNVGDIVDRDSIMKLSQTKRQVRIDRMNFHKEQKDCIDKLSNDMNWDIMNVGCI